MRNEVGGISKEASLIAVFFKNEKLGSKFRNIKLFIENIILN